MCGGMKRDMREKQEVLIAFLHFGLLLLKKSNKEEKKSRDLI